MARTVFYQKKRQKMKSISEVYILCILFSPFFLYVLSKRELMPDATLYR